jgi:hypothetical protein
MTENTMPTNRDPETEPTDPEQATQQAPQDQMGSLDSQAQPRQSGSSTKRTAPGRMPLFGR